MRLFDTIRKPRGSYPKKPENFPRRSNRRIGRYECKECNRETEFMACNYIVSNSLVVRCKECDWLWWVNINENIETEEAEHIEAKECL